MGVRVDGSWESVGVELLGGSLRSLEFWFLGLFLLLPRSGRVVEGLLKELLGKFLVLIQHRGDSLLLLSGLPPVLQHFLHLFVQVASLDEELTEDSDHVEIVGLVGLVSFGENAFEHLFVVVHNPALLDPLRKVLIEVPNENQCQVKRLR